MKCFLVPGVLVLIGLLGGPVRAAEGPSKEVPELEPLNHYAGNWGSEMTIKGIEKPIKATVEGKWIHNGLFLQQTWRTEAEGDMPSRSGTTIMTYDPRKKAYRSWSFNSAGGMFESQGAWDAKARTMTWTMRDTDSGATMTTKATFAEDGNGETWSIVEKDGEGKVRGEFHGKNTRQK
jgi:hypothetical protein